MSDQRMIQWPLLTKVDGQTEVVRDEFGEVVWTEIPAPADLPADQTMSPLMTTVDGVDGFVFDSDGEIVATVGPLED